MTPFYILLSNETRPLTMGKVFATSKENAAKVFYFTLRENKDRFTQKEILDSIKEKSELTSRDIQLLEEKAVL